MLTRPVCGFAVPGDAGEGPWTGSFEAPRAVLMNLVLLHLTLLNNTIGLCSATPQQNSNEQRSSNFLRYSTTLYMSSLIYSPPTHWGLQIRRQAIDFQSIEVLAVKVKLNYEASIQKPEHISSLWLLFVFQFLAELVSDHWRTSPPILLSRVLLPSFWKDFKPEWWTSSSISLYYQHLEQDCA